MNKICRLFQSARGVVACTLWMLCAVAPPATGGVDSGGTGARMLSYARGALFGFGSVIVNGIRFDDGSATILDDDGLAHSRADLKLGMSVEVEGGPVYTDASTGTSSAVAHTIRFGSAIRGPVQAINRSQSSMTVFGQTVALNPSTVFDGLAGGSSSVQVGQVIEVHASLDATSGRYQATRVQPQPSAKVFKLRGVVSQLDSSSRSFSIGTTRIGFAAIDSRQLPALRNGLDVKVDLRNTPANGTWRALDIAVHDPSIPEEAGVDVDGIVSDYGGLASFKLDGAAVNASAPWLIFKNGTSGQIRNGVRAVVSGYMSNGVLLANQVVLKSTGDRNKDKDSIELHGAVESVDTSARRFMLRGIAVTFDDKTAFDHGTASGLKVGAELTVKGALDATGITVLAEKVKFGK